jgi:hypothetical protein
MSTLPPPSPIREYHGMDRRRFEEEIMPLGQPAVFRGLGADWPAVRPASDEAMVEYFNSFPAPPSVKVIVGAPEIKGRFFYTPDLKGLNFTAGQLPLATFFERVLRDRAMAEPFAIAVQSEIIPDIMRGFAEVNRMPLIDASIAPRIWIGNNVRIALHYDVQENVGVVVHGRRRFTLFPPEQLGNLYIGPLEFTPAATPISLVDPLAPDLDRFPRFADAAPFAQQAVLEPGDGIYIPYHWWHAVDSLERFNAFVNYWWTGAPAGTAYPYDALMHGLLAFRALPASQRAVWKMVFDHFVFASHGDPVAHLPAEVKGVLGPPNAEMLGRMRATLKQIVEKM